MITIQRLPAIVASLSLFSSLISATALTYRFTPSEKACFFAHVEEKGQKIAFYFAVGLPLTIYLFYTRSPTRV